MSKEKPRSPSTPHRQSQGGKDFRKRVQRSKQQTETRAPQPASRPRAGNPAAKPCIILKADREKSLLRRHPWIFSGAVECIDGAPTGGDTVPVHDAAGNFLAWAAYNPDSQITARVWSWNEQDVIDKVFFHGRIANALAARRALGLLPSPAGGGGAGGEGSRIDATALSLTLSRERERELAPGNGARIIHGESDGLPGLIVDKYADVLVMQLGSAGPEHWRDALADILQELCAALCRRKWR
jgi:23S rRNA (cytosine1962-C5)-methyltransferase